MNIEHLHRAAARLAAAHPLLHLGPSPTPQAVTRPEDAELPRLEASARMAARMLGFIEPDACAIARAWQARARRTGREAHARSVIEAGTAFEPQELAWPDDPADFGLAPWPRDGAFAACPQELGLYVVAPDAPWTARLARWGVPTVQLRYKPDAVIEACSPEVQARRQAQVQAEVRAQVRAAVRAVEGTTTRLFINDYWRIALEEGAYGVHLGQEDLDALTPADLERMRQAGLRLGLSTHGYAEMLRADAVGPSYLAMGAVYPTTLKAMPTAPQGPHRLAAYARLMRGRPLVAIGGIDATRLEEVGRSGVGSVAVVRAVIGAPDPEAAALSLMQVWQGCAALAAPPRQDPAA